MSLIDTINQLEYDLEDMPEDAQAYHLDNHRFIKKIGERYFYYFIKDAEWNLFTGDVNKADILPLHLPTIKSLLRQLEWVIHDEPKEVLIDTVIKEMQYLNSPE